MEQVGVCHSCCATAMLHSGMTLACAFVTRSLSCHSSVIGHPDIELTQRLDWCVCYCKGLWNEQRDKSESSQSTFRQTGLCCAEKEEPTTRTLEQLHRVIRVMIPGMNTENCQQVATENSLRRPRFDRRAAFDSTPTARKTARWMAAYQTVSQQKTKAIALAAM